MRLKSLPLNHKNMGAPSSPRIGVPGERFVLAGVIIGVPGERFVLAGVIGRPGWDTRTVNSTVIRWLLIFCLLASTPLLAQSTNSVAPTSQQTNQQKAHVLLAATIQALGGQAWLDFRTARVQFRMTKFFQGVPTGTVEMTETAESGYKVHLDLPKQHVIQIFSGDNGWEITYKGKREFSQSELEQHKRMKDHGLTTVLRKWYRNPGTVLIDEGLSQVERHPVENIKLINSANDAVTIAIDAETHLPLRLSYEWRDPRFHDKNVDAFEFDNYQRVDGIATPFTITRTHNGETVSIRYLRSVQYNIVLPKDLFDPDIAAKHLK